ncbi:MAG: hypothetical protein HYT31_02910 [Parcubacteria group bacterium]|nr:hypothetical protein [Parcubacteria group bacterium]
MTNKRAHIKRVLIRCGEFDLARARTVGLVTPFLGTKPKRWRKERTGGLLDGPQYHAENPDDTQEIRDHLKALADTRRRSIKRARRWFCLCSLILLFAGPVLVMLTKAPVTRLDIIPFIVRHPFMMAAVPISFAAILAANRIPGHGIAWIGALQGNWMAKLFAITAWIWLFTMILTHS